MRAALGLGSNLGDRRGHLEDAIAGLAGHGVIEARSAILETAPVGGPLQGDFLNMAVVLETACTPHELLAVAAALEEAAGRERTVRWGPRTLDIDLLLCDDLVIDTRELRVPHPRLAERRFVLEPLAEIAPHWVVSGRMVEELLADLSIRS